MIYKISIGKQTFFGDCFPEKLVYAPVPKKVINNLRKNSIDVFLTHIQVYDHYDVIANFQYGSFPSDKITGNYSYSERDLADMLNIVDKDYLEFYKERIVLLLLGEKVNNQQLCLHHHVGEINRTALTILSNNTSLLFTEIVLYSPEKNNLNNFTSFINFTEKVQDEKDKSKEIIIRSGNDSIKKDEEVDINLCVSKKELIDKFFIMKNIIEAKKLIKKLQS